MKPISVLFGAAIDTSLDSVLENVSSNRAWKPFDPRVIAFVSRLSRRLLTHRRIREYPELAALAHWFRLARIEELASEYVGAIQQDDVMIGRGLVFHIAPGNVDSVSIYSWMLSLLSGNSNIIRVSQSTSVQLEFFLDVLNEIVHEQEHRDVGSRIVIVTYPHDDVLTQIISQTCQVRVVWGGDATVEKIRRIPLRPTASEVVFPDRFSLAAIESRKVVEAGQAEIDRLARSFFNDAYWFAQQACSSPRALYWIGTDRCCAEARERFWSAVHLEVARNNPENTPAMVMSRIAAAFEYAGLKLARPVNGFGSASGLLRLAMEHGLSETLKVIHCGYGLFLEDVIPELRALACQLTDRDQTLSLFGFHRSDIDALVAELPARSLDRIVPIGSALEFSRMWDGFDLINVFTRRIEISHSKYS